MPTTDIDIEGAILAGGQSSRMGRDKSALVLGGVSVLERVGSSMAPLVGRIRVIGDQVTESRGYAVQPDLRPGLGPLSGIHAALTTAESSTVLVVACDLPFVTTELFAGLIELLEGGTDAVVPRVSGRAVPVCALYRRACLERLQACLDNRELKAQHFVASLATTYADEDVLERLDPQGICLKNINTPEDFERAQAIAAADLK